MGRMGVRNRVFPYPGKFSRLGLTHQEPKIAAPSSVCVLGEIMTDILLEAMISPDVLVRVIRHWPDFIFFLGHDVYAFIESKAFTQATISGGLQIDSRLLWPKNCLLMLCIS